MSFTFAYDVTGASYAKAPGNAQLCGYDTGSGGVAWTPAMWQAHPDAVHIDQAPDTEVLHQIRAGAAHHLTSDVLDVENGAVPVGSPLVAAWCRGAQASFSAGTRPGQRRPVLYQSRSNVTANVNALIAGGVTSGVGLWIADWGTPTAEAVAELAAASGPFPVVGLQIANAGAYDVDVFSATWLDDVSGKPAAPWTFGPLRNFTLVNVGPHSFSVSFDAPDCFNGVPPVPAPGISRYQMAVSEGPELRADVTGYPRYLTKGANPEHWQGGGLTPGMQYTAAVRVYDTVHAGPWSTVTFTTSRA